MSDRLPFLNFYRVLMLHNCYVGSSRSFGSLNNLKGNPIAFVERPEPVCVNAGMMNKYIRSVFLLNKAVTLTAVEPFYDAVNHGQRTLLSKKFSCFIHKGCHYANMITTFIDRKSVV